VELGEIEAALARHPGVRAAAATVREDRPGDRRLTAYVVPAAEAPTAEALAAFLESLLPPHMVPQDWVVLAELPLTANGKVDRRALPAPDRARRELEREFVAPRTESEEIIAAIWAEVLGLDRVGLDDNFYEVGGHSLALIRTCETLRQLFDPNLRMIDLMENPTVRLQAEHLGRVR